MNCEDKPLALGAIVSSLSPGRMLEFGSWYGKSAIDFASALKEQANGGHLLCVDTWLGSPEHWGNHVASSYWSQESLLLDNGEPTFFLQFQANIKAAGVGDYVSWLRAPTNCAFEYLKAKRYRADLVYIDADHSFRAVRKDLHYASKLLEDSMESVIIGDDWRWASVKLAVVSSPVIRRKVVLSMGNTYALVGAQNRNIKSKLYLLGFRKISRASIVVMGITAMIWSWAHSKIRPRIPLSVRRAVRRILPR